MPTYDYLCGSCEHTFEELQMITAKPLRKCPECGKMKLKRLIGTGAAVIFKGSGFYETDYRSESYSKAKKAESDKKETKTETTTSTEKGDSKPAAKTETKTKPKTDSKKK